MRERNLFHTKVKTINISEYTVTWVTNNVEYCVQPK